METMLLLALFPHRVHVLHPQLHMIEVIVRLDVRSHVRCDVFDAESLDRRIRIERVGRYPGLLADAVLHQAVDQSHLRAHELGPPTQLLLGEGPVMDKELQVELRDIGRTTPRPRCN